MRTGQSKTIAPAPAPAAHVANATASSQSLFVIEALLATFTRSSDTSLQGTLLLQSVSPFVTWFSGEACSERTVACCSLEACFGQWHH